MEAGSGPQGTEKKRYLTTLTFSHSGNAQDIETAMDEARGLIGCGEEREMQVLSGSTHIAREREPVEEFTYGSETVFRNEHALALARGEAWARPGAVVSEAVTP